MGEGQDPQWVSVSAVADTSYCQRLAVIKHLLKIPPPNLRACLIGRIKHEILGNTTKCKDKQKWLSKARQELHKKERELRKKGVDKQKLWNSLEKELKARARKKKKVYPTLTELFVKSKKLGIRGRVDSVEVIHGELVPHEYKSSWKVFPERVQRDEVQLACYGLLIQESMRKPCQKGILEYPAYREEVAFNPELLDQVLEAKQAFRSLARKEKTPSSRQDCQHCYYQQVCRQHHQAKYR